MNLDGELAVAIGYALRRHGPQTDLPDGTGTGCIWPTLATLHREDCDLAFRDGAGSWRHVLLEEVYEAIAEHDETALRAELLQVAAVCIRWVTAIDTRGLQ